MIQAPLEVYRIDMKYIRNVTSGRCIDSKDTKIRRHDNADTRKKKELLIKELEWCNEHARDLTNTANVLYAKYVSGEKFAARELGKYDSYCMNGVGGP